jgi:hypothetical protein
MSARGAAAILAVALAPALGSCALIRGGSAEGEEEPVPETVLVVVNRHWANVTVYILRGHSRVRIGTVNSMASQEFVVPAILVGRVVDLRLVADPVGGDPYISDEVLVGPGDRIEFRLANILGHSSISVWQ